MEIKICYKSLIRESEGTTISVVCGYALQAGSEDQKHEDIWNILDRKNSKNTIRGKLFHPRRPK